jgi:hypothetical protein
MEAMGDLKGVADEILRKLERGELPVRSETAPSSSDSRERSASSATLRRLTLERLTIPQARRREVIKAMILRYRMERYLDPLSDDALYDEVRAYDEHFTYNRIPTERLKEVYLEAMAHHGQYALVVSDFLAAWARIKERELMGHEQAARAKKPSRPNCSACRGTGKIKRAVPKPGVPMWVDCDEAEAECVYCSPVVTNLAVCAAS